MLVRRSSPLFFGLIIISSLCQAAVVTWNNDGDGNWSVAGNWDTGGVPTDGDDVVLLDPNPGTPADIVITLDADTANLASLTIQSANIIFSQGNHQVLVNSGGNPDVTLAAGTWNQGTGRIQIGGDFLNSGGLFNGSNDNGNIIEIDGDFTNNPGQTFVATRGTMSVTGDFNNQGTFTHNNGTVILDSAGAQSIDPGASILNNIRVDNAGTLSLVGNNLDLANNLNVTGGRFDTGAFDLSVANETRISAGATLATSTGTITLNSVPDNSGTIEATGVGGKIEFNDPVTSTGVIRTTDVATLDFNSTADLSGGTLSFVLGSTVMFASHLIFSVASTITHNNQPITFDGNTDLTTGGKSLPGVVVNGRLNLQDSVTLENGLDLLINGGGQVITGDHDLIVPGDISGAGTLDASGQGAASEITVGGDFDVTTFTKSAASAYGLVFNDAEGDNVQNLVLNGNTFGVITIDDSTGSGLVVSTSGDLDVEKLILSDGALNAGANDVVTDQLVLSGGELRVGAELRVDGTTTLAGGEISTSGASILDFNGDFSASAASVLDLHPSTVIYVSGDFDLTNVIIQISGVVGDLIGLISNPALRFDGNTTFTPQANTKLPHTLIEGTVDQAGFDMEIGDGGDPRDLTFNGGDLTVSIGLQVHGTTTLGSTITFAAGSVSTLHGRLTVDTGDVVNFSGGTVTFLGGITNNGSGVFNAMSGTANLNATQSIEVKGNGDINLPTTVLDSGNSGALTVSVTGGGNGSFVVGNFTFGGGNDDLITTDDIEINFGGSIGGLGGTIRSTAGATLDFDGSLPGANTLNLDLDALAVLEMAADVNLTNINFTNTPLPNLASDPAVIFDGMTNLWSAGNTWPHTNVDDADGNVNSTVVLRDDFTLANARTLDVEVGTFNVGSHTLTAPSTVLVGRDAGAAATLTSQGALDFNDDVTVKTTGTLTATAGTVNFEKRLLSGEVGNVKGGKVLIYTPTVVTAETESVWLMSGNGAPDLLGNLVVTSGIKLTIDATVTGNEIRVPGTTTVESASLILDDRGDLTLVGRIYFNDRSLVENQGTGTLTIMNGGVMMTLIARSQFLNTGGGNLVFTCDVLNDTTVNITVSNNVTFARLINKGTISLVNTVTVEGELLNNGVILIGDDATDGILSVGSLDHEGLGLTKGHGTIIFSQRTGNLLIVNGDIKLAGTFDPGRGTVRLTGTGILRDNTHSFYNLEIIGGTRTLETDLHVRNDLAVGASFAPAVTVKASILKCEGFNVTVDGTTYISDVPAGGSGPATGLMTATGGLQTLGEIRVGNRGNYDNGGSNVTIRSSDALTNNGTMVLGSGSAHIFSITNNGQLTSTSGELIITSDFTDSGTFNHNGGTINFSDNGDFDPNPTTEYNNLVKSGLGTETDLLGDLVLLGTLTVESGVLDAEDESIAVRGNLSVSSLGRLNMNHAAADLILQPISGQFQTFDPGVPSSVYTDIIKRGDGTTELIGHDLTLSGGMSVESGRFNSGAYDITISGTLDIDDAATFAAGTGTLVVNGKTIVDGILKAVGVGTHRFNGTPISLEVQSDGFYDNGDNAVTVYCAGGVTNAGTIALGSGEVDVYGDLTNTNILTSTSGTLRVVGSDFATDGSGAVFNHRSGTVVLAGNGTFSPGTNKFNNIIKTGGNTVTTVDTDLTAIGTLIVDSGTIALGNNTVRLGELILEPKADGFSGTGPLFVSGNFTNNLSIGSRYSHTGQLSLTGQGEFTPGLTTYFNNLFTSGTIDMVSGSTFRFAGQTWTNTGQFVAGESSTVRFVRSGGNQTLNTTGTPDTPGMTFFNIETDNDDTVTFATQLNIGNTLTIAAGATVRSVTPCSVYMMTPEAKVIVDGTWDLVGSAAEHICLLGIGQGEGGPRWTLQINSGGTVNMNYVSLRDSELVIHGGSLNAKNVNHVIESLGNLSPSWGPYDPIPSDGVPSVTADDDPVDRLPGDADGNGVVDLTDFSILAATFATSDTRADFNGDGIVDLMDFSILTQNFGRRSETMSAAPGVTFANGSRLNLDLPTRAPRTGDIIDVAVRVDDASFKAYSFQLVIDESLLALEGQIEEGDFLRDTLFFVRPDGLVMSASRTGASHGSGVLARFHVRVKRDGSAERAIVLRDPQIVDENGNMIKLPEISAEIATAPNRTRVFANYPNPFNPETWFPFQLAEDADVRIDIFDLSGRLIRSIDLGRVPAGHYVKRSVAAYWDGKNRLGEDVGSGIYIYRFTAGGFSATRKMVVMK